MTEVKTKFEVLEVVEREELNAVVLQGRVREGQVLVGMNAKVWVDGGLYMTALITAIEHEGDCNGRDTVKLILDAPESDVRELWLALCQAGDVLPIEMQS